MSRHWSQSGDAVGDHEHLPSQRLQVDLGTRSPLVTRSTTPHSQIAVESAGMLASQRALAQGSPSSSSMGSFRI